jgi:hypothetical protein
MLVTAKVMTQTRHKLPYMCEKDLRQFDHDLMVLLLREWDARMQKHVAQDNKELLYHGRKWIFQREHSDGYSPCEGTIEPHSIETRIDLPRVVANDLHVVSDFISKTVSDLETQFLHDLLRETKDTGQAVTVPKEGSLADGFLEMVRRGAASIGSDGKPSTPNLYLFGKDYRARLEREIAERGPEFKKQVDEIRQAKEKEALEREKQRLARYDCEE